MEDEDGRVSSQRREFGGGALRLAQAPAKTLAAAGKSYIVLEARDRVGGRVHNKPLPVGGPNAYTEVGGTYFGPTQDYSLALAKELGVDLYETYNTGKNVYYNKGSRATADAESFIGQAIPAVDPISLVQLLSAQADIDSMAKKINLSQPWNSTSKAVLSWDSKTFGAWLDGRGLTKSARAVMDTACGSIFSAEPSELSLLYTIAYIAAAGNATNAGTSERVTSTGDGSQMYRVVGGTEILASNLAAKLGSANIRLNSPVRTVKRNDKGNSNYTVTLRSGKSFNARSIIVAMSPPIASRIGYDPPLPAARDQLSQRLVMGSIGKLIATYKEPFWRKAGLTGQAVSGSGTVRVTFDQSLPDGSVYALMGFIEADEMRRLDNAPEAQIIAEIMQDFVNYFGPQARNATSYTIQRWDLEEFSRGGPTAVAGPGVYTSVGPALRAPAGGIHFAGTESATYWVGYISGALESGERAAKEVIAKA
ncbi:hypothetical protein V8E36_005060 [Tilletia maclaganii]